MILPQAAQILQQGLRLHQAGRLAEAERLYQQVLRADPGNVDALRFCGLLAHQTGRNQLAIQLLSQSIARNPNLASSHNNLGEAYRVTDQFDRAVECFNRALALQPNYPEAHNNLGSALQAQGKSGAAREHYHTALRLRPGYANAHLNLAASLLGEGDATAALAEIDSAIRNQPNHPTAHALRGDALARLGKMDEAIAAYQRAVQLNPNDADVYESLGRALRHHERLQEAAAAYLAALKLDPKRAAIYNNLGEVYRAGRQLGPAMESFRKAIELEPDLSEPHGNYATVLASLGDHEAAMDHLRKALALNPDNLPGHSSLLMELNYFPPEDPKEILAEHVRWYERHAAHLAPADSSSPALKAIERSSLRIGYVSADLRLHPIAFFLEPLLREHDRSRFSIFCYSDTRPADAVTEHFRAYPLQWREVIGLSDEQLAEQIRADGIDILFDLAGHTGRNRLLVFARKPAPIQITYMGYPNTSGLATMDYRMTDAIADPEGSSSDSYCPSPDDLHVEKLIRLPHCFLCYHPFADAPPVNQLPAQSAGHITFGSFNKFAKISEQTMAAWREILERIPDSHLAIKSASGSDRASLAMTRQVLERNGLPADRIRILGMEFGFREHLANYHQIDIALDSFPYNGTTTTCEALWMGVPVITVAGRVHAARVGASLLSNALLPEFVAAGQQQYINLAVALAGDLDRLARYRSTLRDRLVKSPLLDAPGFARDFERALMALGTSTTLKQSPAV